MRFLDESSWHGAVHSDGWVKPGGGDAAVTAGRHLVHEDVLNPYLARLAEKADHLPVGDPATETSRSGRSSTNASVTRSTHS